VFPFFDYVYKYWFGAYTPRGDASDRKEGGITPLDSFWTIWIQLFARSQNQYLFPASIEHKRERGLSDIGLVKWYKAVLEDATASTTKLENNY
jgi:hypothetical protein